MYNRGRSFKSKLISYFFGAVVIAGICGGIWLADQKYHFASDNNDFDYIINKAALRHNLDPLFIKAVIWRESKFRPHTRGNDGEIGLMQIMPKSATSASVVEDWERAHGVRIKSEGNLFSPETNIEIGTWYLAKAIGHWTDYKYKYELGLCEYNKGKSRVNVWVKGLAKDDPVMGNVDSTVAKNYVKAIMVKYQYYKSKENEEY